MRSRAVPPATVCWAAEIASATHESLWARVRPPEAALGHLRAARLAAAAAAAFVHGQAIELARAADPPAGFFRVHDESGLMLGVGELLAGGRQLKPSRILHADRPGTRVLPA